MFTNARRTINTILTSTALLCAAATGCGPGSVLSRIDAIDHTTNALSLGSLLEVNGTYGSGCTARSGSWSAGLGGFSGLSNPVLSVVTNDTGCSLTMTSMRIGSQSTNKLYTPDSDINLGSSYANKGTPMRENMGDPISIYLNAHITPDLLFAADFTIQMVYSDDPSLTTGQKSAAYGVQSSSVSASNVTAPDYALSFDNFVLTVDAAANVLSASGYALLDDTMGMAPGEDYVVTSTDLGDAPSFADVDADFNAGTAHTIGGTTQQIDPSYFNLSMANVTSGVKRNVIVRHQNQGTASYERFLVTFNKP